MSRGTTIAPAAGQRKEFLVELERSRESIATLLPDPKAVDRVLRVARTSYQTSPELQKCSGESIIAAVMKACELGLEPAGALKHAYLIPYAGECTFQISYFGMLELARRSGEFRVIEARLIRSGDHFELYYDPRPVFRHDPDLTGSAGNPTHAYAYALLANGEKIFEIMSAAEIEHVRSSSQCGPVWKKHWGEMAKKTVIKRMLKRQPCSVKLAEAIEHDNRDYLPAADVTAPQAALGPRTTSRSAELAARLALPERGVPGEAEEDEAEEPAGRQSGEEG